MKKIINKIRKNLKKRKTNARKIKIKQGFCSIDKYFE